MLSAGLPRRKCGYPLLVKTTVGIPVSPFHKDILHTKGSVIKQNVLMYLHRLQYCPHDVILNLLIDFNQFVSLSGINPKIKMTEVPQKAQIHSNMLKKPQQTQL